MDKETSARVSSIAADYANITVEDIFDKDQLTDTERTQAEEHVEKVRTLAASALSQDEHKGQEPATFLDRLKAEHAQLIDRHRKLAAFLKTGAPGASNFQRALLDVQANTMSVYIRVLEMRLNDLGDPAEISEFKTTRVASEKEIPIGEAREIGGHDEDRDGPIPFDT